MPAYALATHLLAKAIALVDTTLVSQRLQVQPCCLLADFNLISLFRKGHIPAVAREAVVIIAQLDLENLILAVSQLFQAAAAAEQ